MGELLNLHGISAHYFEHVLDIEYRATSDRSLSIDAYRDGDFEMEIQWDDVHVNRAKDGIISEQDWDDMRIVLTEAYDKWAKSHLCGESGNISCDGDHKGLRAYSTVHVEREDLVFLLVKTPADVLDKYARY